VRRTFALIAAVVFVAAGQTAAGDTPEEACFRTTINYERTRLGIPELKPNAAVQQVARAHSAEMASRDTIYHDPNLAEELPPFQYAGENVGMGASCDQLHQAFMNSPGHRANILDRDFTDLGVGVSIKDDTLFVTEDFFRPAVIARPPPSSPRPRPRGSAPCGR